jgi:hypothetical protein
VHFHLHVVAFIRMKTSEWDAAALCSIFERAYHILVVEKQDDASTSSREMDAAKRAIMSCTLK